MRPPHPRASDPPFRCTSWPDGHAAVRIEASGELDLETAPLLERALREALDVARLLVLDLGGVSFVDAYGLHVIEDAGLRALLCDRRLIVVGASAHVARVVALAGLSGTIDLLDADVPAAEDRLLQHRLPG